MSDFPGRHESAPSPSEKPFTTGDAAKLAELLAHEDQPRAPRLTEGEMTKWMSQAERAGLYDRPSTLRTGDGAEQVQVEDALYLAADRSASGEREPIVIVRHADGRSEDLGAHDFLDRTGFNVQEFRLGQARQAVERAASRHNANAQIDNEVQAQHQDEYNNRQDRLRILFQPEVGERTRHYRLTPRMRDQAAGRLEHVLGRDREATDLMRDYVRHHPAAGEDAHAMVDAIRTDPDLRLSLGEHYLMSIDRLPLDIVPRRVRTRAKKRPDRTGELTASHEYVAQLCLSMLDGTYNNENESSTHDNIVLNHRGVAIEGEHRHTARLLLGLDNMDAQAAA